jgi:hypothetical protein
MNSKESNKVFIALDMTDAPAMSNMDVFSLDIQGVTTI